MIYRVFCFFILRRSQFAFEIRLQFLGPSDSRHQGIVTRFRKFFTRFFQILPDLVTKSLDLASFVTRFWTNSTRSGDKITKIRKFFTRFLKVLPDLVKKSITKSGHSLDHYIGGIPRSDLHNSQETHTGS